jgi:hypothetical protein
MTPTRDASGRLHLEQIQISSPCTVPWNAMRGDHRVRFCRECRQNVFNVEAMTRAEAERLIADRDGRVCIRMLRRPDGTVVTADCWARLRAARRRGLLPFLGMLVVVGWAQLAAMRFGLNAWHRTTGAPPPAPPVAVLPPPEPLAGKPILPSIKMGEPRSMGHSMGKKAAFRTPR